MEKMIKQELENVFLLKHKLKCMDKDYKGDIVKKESPLETFHIILHYHSREK